MRISVFRPIIFAATLLGVPATRQATDTVPEYLLAATERPLVDFLVLAANASMCFLG